jgi:intracellular sulfur oxidation DsrE/DsrF family protein
MHQPYTVTAAARKRYDSAMLRRAFLSHVPAAATVLGVVQSPETQAAAPASRVDSARHPQGAWFDELPARHRAVFDTWLADHFSEAVAFASNWLRVNKDEYGLTEKDLGLVLVVRHGTGPFAFNEAIWTKYGKSFTAHMSAADVKAHPNPTTNVYAARLTALIKQGMHIAVCNLTTRAYSRMLAEEGGGDADTVYKELTANTLGSAHFVPAGIVALTRAQERGFSLVCVG